MAGKEVTENNYIWYMKTAVAFACIRCKPNGLSAREFTEKLCAQYRAAEGLWKQKYEQAQQTVLRLKQSQELQSHINFSGLSDIIPFVSFDNCSLSHNGNEEPMEMDGNFEHVRHNTDFIKSYLLLKQLNREISEKVTSSTSLQSTLENSLTLICRSIHHDEVLSIQIITDCFRVIRHLSSLMEHHFPHEQLKELVLIIIDRVLRSDKLERKQRGELIFTLRDLLIPPLRGHILDSLLAAIETFSIHLRTVSQSATPLNTEMYENMYFVFDMFEIVLQDGKSQGSVNIKGESVRQEITSTGQPPTADLLSEVTERLDQCVLYISDIFPLFACKIWLIKCKHL